MPEYVAWCTGKSKTKIEGCGRASLTGHIALADRSANLLSLVTILRWMLTGKKDAFLFFPAAGVSQADIDHASVRLEKVLRRHSKVATFSTFNPH